MSDEPIQLDTARLLGWQSAEPGEPTDKVPPVPSNGGVESANGRAAAKSGMKIETAKFLGTKQLR